MDDPAVGARPAQGELQGPGPRRRHGRVLPDLVSVVALAADAAAVSGAGGMLVARAWARAATAVLAQFDHAWQGWVREGGLEPSWAEWARTLAGLSLLGKMLEPLQGPSPTVTTMFPDGSALISAGDRAVIAKALWDAAEFRSSHLSFAPGGTNQCLVAAYRRLARALQPGGQSDTFPAIPVQRTARLKSLPSWDEDGPPHGNGNGAGLG